MGCAHSRLRTKVDVRDLESSVHTGDIILFSSKHAAAHVTKCFTASTWDHCGLVVKFGHRHVFVEYADGTKPIWLATLVSEGYEWRRVPPLPVPPPSARPTAEERAAAAWTAVDHFHGALGGFSCVARRLGGLVIAACDKNPEARKTYMERHHRDGSLDKGYHLSDIRHMSQPWLPCALAACTEALSPCR